MALTFNGVQDSVPTNDKPNGFSTPDITMFNDVEAKSVNLTISVLKSGTENADPLLTYAAIIADIDTQVQAILSNDLDVTNTVTAFAVFNTITSNAAGPQAVNFYDTNVVSYLCGVTYKYKVA